MAYQGPSYGLSRECQMKSQAKFSLERAQESLDWLERVLDQDLDYPDPQHGLQDQHEFGNLLKDGILLCKLINALQPGAVKRINTMSAPFKQRENIEMFLKGCVAYGLKPQDLFQVNDLYEHKNLYMVVDCIHALGGTAQKKGFQGPVLGVKVANENKRNFSADVLKRSEQVIGLQYGTNQGASQAGMTAYGASRQILPNGR